MVESLYQVLLPLSVIVTLFVVARLYYAIKLLNERVANLSRALTTLRESTRRELANIGVHGEDTDSLSHFVEKEQVLGARMRRDFSYKENPLHEIFARWRVDTNLPPPSRPGEAGGVGRERKSAREIRGRELKPSEQAALRNVRNLRVMAARSRSRAEERRTEARESGEKNRNEQD